MDADRCDLSCGAFSSINVYVELNRESVIRLLKPTFSSTTEGGWIYFKLCDSDISSIKLKCHRSRILINTWLKLSYNIFIFGL